MIKGTVRSATLVVGVHVVDVRVDGSGAPRSMIVRVEMDGQRSWRFQEPGWRELGYGVSAEGSVPYLWSARHLVVMPTVEDADPLVVSTDEDIHFVFSVAEGWVLVCETSVRLIRGFSEVSRLEAGDVLLTARWEGPQLLVGDAAGGNLKIRIKEGRISATRFPGEVEVDRTV